MAETPSEALPPQTRKRRKGGGAKFLFMVMIILALLAFVVYHFSVINRMKFFLVPEGGKLHVKRGVLFLSGSEEYLPDNKDVAWLYEPIDLPLEFGAQQKEFSDREEMNKEFASILIRQTQQLIFSPEDAKYAKGRSYLRRLNELQVKAEHVKLRTGLNADVDYIEAKRAYLGVEMTLEHALKKFRQAETYGSGRFADSPDWIGKVEGLLRTIRATKAGELPIPLEPEPRPALRPAPGADLRPETPTVAPPVAPPKQPKGGI